MKSILIILLAASAGAISCQRPVDGPNPTVAVHPSAIESSEGEARPIPKPIAGGDIFPDLPHHRAGIIHQFYPADRSVFGDGPWVEPNGMTDFNGFVAQVFMGGTAVDNKGNQYVVDTDIRVYRGEYIGTNGEHARGTFCEI